MVEMEKEDGKRQRKRKEKEGRINDRWRAKNAHGQSEDKINMIR